MVLKQFKIKLIRFIILVLDWIIPKQKNLIIYGARGTTAYFDNTRYFFEFMVRNHLEFENVWLTHSQKVLEEFYLGGCYEIRCKEGLWKFLRAKFLVMSHGYGDFDIFLTSRNRKKKIMLWHGIPIKKIMLSSDYKILKKAEKFDLFTVSSRLEQYLMSYCFGLQKGIAQVIGTPRQDILLENLHLEEANSRNRFLSEIGINVDIDKIILYAPTYRENGTLFFPFILNEKRIKTFLEDINGIIIIRQHFNEKLGILSGDITSILNRVVFLPQTDYPDVCDFLHLVDVLITDYSSLYFDFLLMDKPIIFLPYDIEKYEQKWGFLYPYKDIIAGRMVTTFDDFMDSLELSILIPDAYKKDRNRMRELFFETTDGKSCERIFEWIQVNQ